VSKNLLIVEGNADKHFIKEFLRCENLDIDLDVHVATAPEVDNNVNYTTKQGVIKALNTLIPQLNDGRYERIGTVVDMDFRHDSKLSIKDLTLVQLSNVLNQYDFNRDTKSIDNQGIFFMSDEFDHPIGVWLMPDNDNEGYLEHWIINSIKDKSMSHFDKAELFIENFDNTHFKSTTIAKAKVYTWLAIQKKPCMDLSRCLNSESNLLDRNSSSYQNFKAWIVKTFS